MARRLGRYLLLELLGRGGMGEVWRAQVDGPKGFSRQCVVKRLLPELTRDAELEEALLIEARLYALLRHPGIVQLLELGEAEDEWFLVLEFVEGCTLAALADRCRAGARPLPVELACHIAAEIAGALGYAHALADDQGRALEIVHRDITPANIMITPSGTVKLLDFGVAKAQRMRERTQTGLLRGTPAYMAPEQADGRPVDRRADLFALGVVLHEALTGARLFRGRDNLETLRLVREAPMAAPSTLRPEVTPALDVVVATLLARDPAARYQLGEEVARALLPFCGRTSTSTLAHFVAEVAPPRSEEQEPGRAIRATARPRSQRRRRRLPLALSAAALALIAATGWGLLRRPAHRRAPPAHRTSVAMAGFDCAAQGAETSWLATVLAEAVATGLRAEPELQLLWPQRDELATLGPAPAGLGREALGRIRSSLGADVVVSGTCAMTGAGAERRLRVEVRLQETQSGRLLLRAQETGRERELFEVADGLTNRLARTLGGEPQRSAVDRPSVASARPSYGEAMVRLRHADAVGARPLLERVVERDPSFALGHAALAEAWSWLGYDDKARAAAEHAVALADSAPAATRVEVDAVAALITHDWSRAVAGYSALAATAPASIEYGIRLASALRGAGRPGEALALLRGLQCRLWGSAKEDPRLALAEARAAMESGDLREARAAAARAAHDAAPRDAPLLEAQAELVQGNAEVDLGEHQAGIALIERARDRFGLLGDRAGFAQALGGLAHGYSRTDDLERAARLHEQARGVWEEVGSRPGVLDALRNLALVRQWQGKLDIAKQTFERALALSVATGDKVAQATILKSLGMLLVNLQDRAAGDARLREALALATQIGNPQLATQVRLNLAISRSNAGELAAAEPELIEVAELLRQLGDRRGVCVALNRLGEIQAAEGKLATARKLLEKLLVEAAPLPQQLAFIEDSLAGVALWSGEVGEARERCNRALAIRLQAGETVTAAETRLDLSEVVLAEGHAEEALELANLARAALGSHADIDTRWAEDARARALLALGRVGEAARASAAAKAEPGDSIVLRLRGEVTAARVAGTTGKSDAARVALERIRREANAHQLVIVELEAWVASCELEERRSRAGANRCFAAVERQAAGFGARLFTRRARRPIDSSPSVGNAMRNSSAPLRP